MDKQKKQLIITGILVVVMVIMMGRSFFGGKKRAAVSHGNSASQPSVSAETIAMNMGFLAGVRQSESAWILQDAEWQKPWGRDPFGAGDSGVSFSRSPANFSLSGVVWDDKSPMAIVNDKLLQAGDLIDGCQVKEIRRASVSIVCDNVPYELKLFKSAETGNHEGR